MNKKPTTPKKNQTKSAKAPFYKQRWVVVLLIVALLVFGWLIFKEWRLEHNKRAAKTQVEQTLDSFKDFSGTVVYQDIQDQGCETNDEAWNNFTNCHYVGVIIFRNKLAAAGGQSVISKYPQVFLRATAAQESNKNISVTPHVFDKTLMLPSDTTTPAQLFQVEASLPVVGETEYLYGFIVDASYLQKWSVF